MSPGKAAATKRPSARPSSNGTAHAVLDDASLDKLDDEMFLLRHAFRLPGFQKRVLGAVSRPIEINMIRLMRRIEASARPPTVGDLAEALMIDASTASRMAERAVAAGLLEREICASDRRKVRLSLTDEGRAVVDVVTRERRALLAEITATWEPHEVTALIGLFERLNAGFAQLETGGE